VRRVGDRLEPLTADELRRHAATSGQVEVQDILERLLAAVNDQSDLIDRLRNELAQATSAKRQWQYGLIFVAVGAAVSVALAIAVG
jgi:hypothetical protein